MSAGGEINMRLLRSRTLRLQRIYKHLVPTGPLHETTYGILREDYRNYEPHGTEQNSVAVMSLTATLINEEFSRALEERVY
jgi:hypothetical protein